ncbi:MAG TPA: DUF4184 family protein [Acidimicrobiia bacterium]|jgi:hypothetical protein|nr:DUF4184 family protein [Acidimicrobiia bacterium]
MPFTVAHVVLARPLWRAVGRQLPLSGIVVGSVAPDLEYLAHLDTERTIGHQLHGVFLLDLPLALVLLALWHGLIKEALAALVSPRLRPPIETSPFAFGPAARFGLVVASILTGVAGHLLWDGFTHRDGFITTRVDFLQEAIGRPHVYDLFNYASTVAGMLLLGWWWWRAVEARAEPAFAAPAALPAGVRRIALATLIALSAAGGIANGARLRLDGWGIETTVIGAILGAMAAGLFATVVVSAVLRAGLRRC